MKKGRSLVTFEEPERGKSQALDPLDDPAALLGDDSKGRRCHHASSKSDVYTKFSTESLRDDS